MILLAVIAAAADAQTISFRGYANGRGTYSTGYQGWTAGGFGHFDVGGGGPREGDAAALAGAQLAVEWRPAPWLTAHVHGLARTDPPASRGRRTGLVAAFLQANLERGSHDLQLRAGQFFLPTSRENVGDLWTSPYALSFSALNKWIGEEFRPLGVDAQWRILTPALVVTAGGTAFRGNDTMGALLAWRGWSIGDRISVYNEVLPLPPLPTLQTVFTDQRHDGTKPFGSDLDGRTGLSARLRLSRPERALFQYTFADNRGDRLLYRGEYAWQTRFHLLSAEFGDRNRTLAAAEYMTGSTGMGFGRAGSVDLDFYAAYALLSQRVSRQRFTFRYDIFATYERDFSLAESNDENGRAWTLAWLVDITENIRGGVEFTQMTGRRAAIGDAGFEPMLDGRTISAELRYTVK